MTATSTGPVEVVISGESFAVPSDAPLIFGRSSGPGVVGLDPDDMGISAEAGSIEYLFGVWWVRNRSRKRHLLLEQRPGAAPIRLDPQDRHVITRSTMVVLVPGIVFTHRLEVVLPEAAVADLPGDVPATSGTITNGDLGLSQKDRDVLTGLCAGHLRVFPRHDPRPLTYAEIASLLGHPWTGTTVRKQIDRIKARLTRRDLYFEGPRANELLLAFLLDERAITADDLERLEGDR